MTLRTACSCGLNDIKFGMTTEKDKTELFGVKFPSLTRRHSRTRRIKYSYASKMSGKKFLFRLNKDLINNLPNKMKLLPVSIASLSKNL